MRKCLHCDRAVDFKSGRGWVHMPEGRAYVMQHEYMDDKRLLPIAETMPHPNAYFAKKGKTLKDYILYFAKCSTRWHDLTLAPVQVKDALRKAGFQYDFWYPSI